MPKEESVDATKEEEGKAKAKAKAKSKAKAKDKDKAKTKARKKSELELTSGSRGSQPAKYHDRLRKRGCTDVLCLVIFVIFLLAWIGLGVYAFLSGTPEKLIAPTDSQGHKCGFDKGYENKPHLFFFDLTRCGIPASDIILRCATPQVCVEKCPPENFAADYFIQNNELPSIKDRIICRDEVNVNAFVSVKEVEVAIKNQLCAGWHLGSVSVVKRCLPKALQDSGKLVMNIVDEHGNPQEVEVKDVDWSEILSGTQAIHKVLFTVKEFGDAVVQDFKTSWPWIVVCVVEAMVISLLFIVIMRWVTGIMVWLSVIGCLAALSVCCYLTWTKYADLRDGKGDSPIRDFPYGLNFLAFEQYGFEETYGWLALFCICCIVLAVLLLLIIFLRNRIVLGVALIREGSKAVGAAWTALLFPVIPWIFHVAVIIWGIFIFFYLFSTGIPIHKVVGLNTSTDGCTCINGYTDGSVCDTDSFQLNCKNSNNMDCTQASCAFAVNTSKTITIYFQLGNLFMLLWAFFFVSAVGNLILASAFATYYWTFDKKDVPFFIVLSSIGRVCSFHLGTAAFGAFLLAFLSWIRIMFELISQKLVKHENACTKCVICFCRCWLWILHKLLKFLTTNAYIVCAIRGSNFCSSAITAVRLIVDNCLRVLVIDKLTDFLFLFAKLLITAVVGATSYFIFSKPQYTFDDLVNGKPASIPESQYYWVPIIFLCIVTYFITSLFFGVYTMAVNTLFFCFLDDLEENDGSPEKPYYMSSNLMKILGKKNKQGSRSD